MVKTCLSPKKRVKNMAAFFSPASQYNQRLNRQYSSTFDCYMLTYLKLISLPLGSKQCTFHLFEFVGKCTIVIKAPAEVLSIYNIESQLYS